MNPSVGNIQDYKQESEQQNQREITSKKMLNYGEGLIGGLPLYSLMLMPFSPSLKSIFFPNPFPLYLVSKSNYISIKLPELKLYKGRE